MRSRVGNEMPHKFKIGDIVNVPPRGSQAPRGRWRVHSNVPGAWRWTSRSIGSSIQARSSSESRWRASCQLVSPSMANDDPRAPYKVYEGDEVKGSYPTRAEARRAQQRLAEAEPQQNFIIRDVLGDVVS